MCSSDLSNGIPFDKEDSFGKKATITIDGMSSFKDVGIIVRLNDWAQKDIADDRFITKFDGNGAAEIWLIQGDKTIYYSQPNVDSRFVAATFSDFRTIDLQLSQDIALTSGANDFSLTNGPKVISVKNLNGTEKATSYVQLTLDSDVVIGTNYTVTHPKFGAYQIGRAHV